MEVFSLFSKMSRSLRKVSRPRASLSAGGKKIQDGTVENEAGNLGEGHNVKGFVTTLKIMEGF